MLYSIDQNPNDGSHPLGRLTEFHGVLYGVTSWGPGSLENGTVFGVKTSGGEKVVCTIRDGRRPAAGLTMAQGTLYGTTQSGGRYRRGEVFAASPSCSTSVLYSFHTRRDGKAPLAPLLYLDGMLYGTTFLGGDGDGTVFGVSLSGQERVLHRFKKTRVDGSKPLAGLTNVQGVLYGTTMDSSGSSNGTVYRVTFLGRERVLYNFPANPYDAASPNSEMINVRGRLYGTTPYGGVYGSGAFYTITTSGKERVLYSFDFDRGGAYPTGLVYGNGMFYGTTEEGGGPSNDGTIFSLTKDGVEATLYDFQDGYPGPLLYKDGVLYGATGTGGTYGQGTVFAFTP